MKVLETKRICLRQWKKEDYEPFYFMSMDPVVKKYLPGFPDRTASDAFLDRVRETLREQGWGFWAMERKEDAAFMGMVGMHRPGPEFGIGEECVEIGWRLAPAFWGKGYVTEAAREVLRFGFEELNLEEIVSFTALENIRSIGVMERLGMECSEKVFDLLFFPEGHPYRPHCVYRMSLRRWQKMFS